MADMQAAKQVWIPEEEGLSLGVFPGQALRASASKKDRAAHDAAFQKWAAEENERIAKQRAAFDALPECKWKQALKQAMLDRAWRLLDDGYTEAADMLLEFVTENDATDLLDEFFKDD